jgi:hypothetical protein
MPTNFKISSSGFSTGTLWSRTLKFTFFSSILKMHQLMQNQNVNTHQETFQTHARNFAIKIIFLMMMSLKSVRKSGKVINT